MGVPALGLPILELLTEHELAVSDLYAAFADRCEDMASFWTHLSAAEKGHAALLQKLATDVKSGKSRFHPGPFRRTPISGAIESVRAETVFVKTHSISPLEATSKALAIERNMIERKFFEAVESDSPDVSQFHAAMSMSIREHITRLQTMYDALRDD